MEEKLGKISRGEYTCSVPPVSTLYWTAVDWVNFIDRHGTWLHVKQ